MKARISKMLKNGVRESKDYLGKYYFGGSNFWLLAISIAVARFILNLENSILGWSGGFQVPFIWIIIGAICFFVSIGFFVFGIDPRKQLNKQNIHNQPSWVYYSYWGIINAFLFCGIFQFSENTESWWSGLWKINLGIVLLIIFSKWLNEFISEKIDLSFKRFSAGAVGKENDELGFISAAKNAADGLVVLKNYVSVVGLYGGLGFGKSSYSRMILENFDTNSTLYTYISLTETNEAKDFSKLFSDRWLETLSERYPKIDINSYLPFMDSILRESGNSIFSEILKLISALNPGLVKTKARFFDPFYSKQNPKFTTNTVAKLFGNISEIKESLWVIVVDEIERAQFDEIYRLVEIVERFKNEGRSGLPIKLLFLFCISDPELSNYLDTFAASDTRAKLLRTFFYEDAKSITHKIFLPPVDPSIKEKYIINALDRVIKEQGITPVGTINSYAIGDPTISFKNHQDAVGYIVGLLKESSPRIINRIVNALDFFYGSFKDKAGAAKKDSIRFSDVVAMEYIKIMYPFLIDFFIKTNSFLVNQTERNNIDAYFIKEELKDKKMDLTGWIEKVIERKLSEIEKPKVLEMVGLVMHYYFDFLEKDYEVKNKDKYFGTTSYPEVMHDYLSLTSDSIQTSYRKNNKFYQQHEKGVNIFLKEIENSELASYARFLFDVPSTPIDINIEVLEELVDRILTQRVEPEPLNIGDTLLDEFVYQIAFQIAAISEKDKSKDRPTKEFRKVFEILKKFFSSKVNIGVKYIVLNSLANDERGSASVIHSRLRAGFNKLLKYFDTEMRALIKLVFYDAEKRYLNGRQIIYKYEENFFYTLYQGWSGSKDAIEEIKKIRNVAKRGLVKYPQAIKIYWDRYPVNENWETFNDVIEGDRFFLSNDRNTDLYMPLSTLLKITKQAKIEDEEIKNKVRFWSKIKDHPSVKAKSAMTNEKDTLKGVLIRSGFLS